VYYIEPKVGYILELKLALENPLIGIIFLDFGQSRI
jgi:hypothetical protein